MTKAEKLKNEVKEFLEDQGFDVVSPHGAGGVIMRNRRLSAMTVHLDPDNKIRFKLDMDVSQDYHISYGDKEMSMEAYKSVPKRVTTIFNHAVILLDLIAWSNIRADERAYLRNPNIGHVSIDAFDSPLIYEDEDLVMRFTLEKSVTICRPVMRFQYVFAPFGDMDFTQKLRPRQGVVFIGDIRKMQDVILHWCALPDNPFRKLRSNCIFQFPE